MKPPSPGDFARWAWWVHLRGLLPNDRPELLRLAQPLWRLNWMLAGPNRELLADELRRSFGRDDEALLRQAYAAAVRAHATELLLGNLDPATVKLHMRIEGREHIDAALAAGKGAIIVYPHAGSIMLMIAALSLGGWRYTQYAARGLAPPEVAAQNPETFGHNRWRAEARAAREAAEDKLPATFLTMQAPARELYRTLERNELVGIAFDGRIGNKFLPTRFLGRPALLNPGAFRLAASTGAALLPVINESPAEGPEICRVGAPLFPGKTRPEALMRSFLDGMEPWLASNAASYGIWLLHCRQRVAVDDHPLFTDVATDERWKRWDQGK